MLLSFVEKMKSGASIVHSFIEKVKRRAPIVHSLAIEIKRYIDKGIDREIQIFPDFH